MESATPPPHPGLLVKALHSSRPEAAAFLKSLGGLGEGLERALTAPSSSRAAGEQQQEAVIVLLLSPFVGAFWCGAGKHCYSSGHSQPWLWVW